jgi:peptidyl-dipeptidase A
VFTDADLEALTLRTYDGLGLDLHAVMGNSDLYAREGKSQHAFCIHVDRSGDVRVLCNVRPNARWAETMLHEFGHAAYDRALGDDLPWFLREPAHALTTEGVAMLFGRLARSREWLGTVVGVPDADLATLAPRLDEARRAALLVFARWVLVMTTFERDLYADPDADLDARWWDLVERFQLVRRPDGRHAPDWAAKIHLAVAPVYYQNYLYGELVASQLQAALAARAGGIVERPDAGRLLDEGVFRPGASQRWDRLIEAATGEPLSVRHFAGELART